MKLTPQKKLVQIEKAIESRVIQSLELSRVVVHMSTNNSTGETVAQMPCQGTMVRRIQPKRGVAHIPNSLIDRTGKLAKNPKSCIGEKYQEKTDVRIFLKSSVSLALIPEEYSFILFVDFVLTSIQF